MEASGAACDGGYRGAHEWGVIELRVTDDASGAVGRHTTLLRVPVLGRWGGGAAVVGDKLAIVRGFGGVAELRDLRRRLRAGAGALLSGCATSELESLIALTRERRAPLMTTTLPADLQRHDDTGGGAGAEE